MSGYIFMVLTKREPWSVRRIIPCPRAAYATSRVSAASRLHIQVRGLLYSLSDFLASVSIDRKTPVEKANLHKHSFSEDILYT
jgi:hypothetical protein